MLLNENATWSYAYENDVQYSFSIPAYYYQGSRVYATVCYKVLKNLDAWIRVARTIYDNRYTVGSGLDEIASNHKTELKLQLKYSF